MKEQKIEVRVEELTFDELPDDQKELVNQSIESLDRSNAKYSKFNVGAAIRLDDGSIVKGANQENAAFPLSLCAERTAIFAAQVSRPDLSITQIAICARNENGLLAEPVTPCGSCRQVMLEMEERYNNSMTVLLYGTAKIYRISSAKQLLPLSFVDANMR